MSAVADFVRPAAARLRFGVWLALALSLTLNVFFIGGLGWAMWAAEPEQGPAERFQAVGRSLDLDPTQRAALRTFGTDVRQLNRTLRESNGPLMRQIWDEMGKPNPDAALISRLTEQATQKRLAFQQAMSSNLMTFLATLTPEQRTKFADLASRRPEGRRTFRLSIP